MKAYSIAVAIGVAVMTASAAADDTSLLGAWRLERAVIAPWVGDNAAPIEKWVGKKIEFRETSVKGPGPLACANARYEATSMPAEGLFQGVLPDSAETAAHFVGITQFPVDGVSMTCDTGIFEFHKAGTAILFALDNVIWTLDRSPGAFAPKNSPSGVVQSFLEAHFNGDMGFDEGTVASKQKWLSHHLKKKIAAYFAKAFPEDEVPPINGDPFTDSQEYPTRFSVGAASVSGKLAEVPVDYADGFRDKRVFYHLVKDAKGWRIYDLKYDELGNTFTGSLEGFEIESSKKF